MNYKNINKKRCRDASFFCQSFLCIPQKKEGILKQGLSLAYCLPNLSNNSHCICIIDQAESTDFLRFITMAKAIVPYAIKLLKYSPRAGLLNIFCPAWGETIKSV